MPLSPGEGCWLAAAGRLEVQARGVLAMLEVQARGLVARLEVQARGVLARLEVLAREEVLRFDNRLVEVLEAKAAK